MTFATRYPSSARDNRHPQGGGGRCGSLQEPRDTSPPKPPGHAGEMRQVPGADRGAHRPRPGQGLPPRLLLLRRLRPGHRRRELRRGRAGRGVLRGRLLQVGERGNGGTPRALVGFRLLAVATQGSRHRGLLPSGDTRQFAAPASTPSSPATTRTPTRSSAWDAVSTRAATAARYGPGGPRQPRG